MARVRGIYKPSDYAADADVQTKSDLHDLFKHLFPHSQAPEIDPRHGGFAIVAQNPRLALLLVQLNDYIVRGMPWTSGRRDLRELAIQALNYHFKCDYSFQTHVEPARSYGISTELQAATPYWRTTNLFNEEQRLVVEYTLAVVSGEVSDQLFAQVVAKYGEKEAVEFTTGIAWWSLWAMIINATRP